MVSDQPNTRNADLTIWPWIKTVLQDNIRKAQFIPQRFADAEIHPALASRFDSSLTTTRIAVNHQPYFHRRLRFYLGFRRKYQQDSPIA
jgi:hypothetical protein